jgi:hypothetical protein
MVKESSSSMPLLPVPLTGSRMGQTMQAPTRQMMARMRRKRRKKKASSEQLLRMYSSVTAKKGLIQLNQPSGSSGVGVLCAGQGRCLG